MDNVTIANTGIKILKPTPFNKEGDIETIESFRLKYSYIGSKEVTDEQLIIYLKTEHQIFRREVTGEGDNYVGSWFKVVELPTNTPLDVIIDGVLWSKQIDGFWYGFIPGVSRKPANTVGKKYAIEISKMIESSRFRSNILFCTSDVHAKV